MVVVVIAGTISAITKSHWFLKAHLCLPKALVSIHNARLS